MNPRKVLATLLLAFAAPLGATSPDDLRAEVRTILYAPGVARPESPALKTYVLYPYVEAARLRASLAAVAPKARDAALEKTLAAFLTSHAGEPVAQPLARDGLMFLADREAWIEFLAALPANGTDAALRCHAVSAHLARKEYTGQREAALALWQDHRDPPPACVPVFEWLEGPGRLTDAEVERRAIFAAQNRLKLPRALARLPASRRALLQLWDRLMNDPAGGLERILKDPQQAAAFPAQDVSAALLEAFARATRRNAKQSRLLLGGLETLAVFDDAQRVELRRLQALGFAYDFDVEALGFFGALPDNMLDDPSREWRVRAALLHQDWRSAQRWLETMPEPQRSEPRWRYWRARVLAQQGKVGEARELFEQVAREREYYAFLAAERLGRKPDLRPVALPDDKALQSQLAARPALARAHELLAAEYPDLALPELRYGLRDDTPATRIQAARLISGWGWYAPALKMLAEMLQWDDLALRFPLPYGAEVDAAARRSALPGSWLYAVLRTESLYDPRAVSGAGALGLVQLKLDTARQVAKGAGLARPSRDDLFQPALNLALGARYLATLHERFGQRLPLTLAAYNAGPDKLREWLPSRPVDGDIWVENIPFNETRGYVQRGLASLVMLEWRRTGKTLDLLPMLQPVGPDRQDASP